MRITELHSEETISRIKEIEEVEDTASIALVESDKIIDGQIKFKTVAGISSNYTNAFSDVFMLEKGRYPQSTGEFALEKEAAQSMKASLGELVNYSIGEVMRRNTIFSKLLEHSS